MTDDPQRRPDASFVIPPPIDTSIALVGAFNSDDLLALTPGGIGVVLVMLLLTFGFSGAAWGIGALSAALLLGGMFVIATSREYTSPSEQLRHASGYLLGRRAFPKSYDDDLGASLHGVRQIDSSGIVYMDDGAMVAGVEVRGANTDLLHEERAMEMATELRHAIDYRVKDHEFRIFATTERVDEDAVIGPLEERAQADAEDLADDRWSAEVIRGYLDDVVRWHRDDDAPSWQPRHWRYYVFVTVRPEEVVSPRSQDRFSWLPWNQSESEQVEENQRREVKSRLSTINQAISGVTGIETLPLYDTDIANVLSTYWTGEERSLPPQLIYQFNRDPLRPDDDPVADVLRPAGVDVSRGSFEVGDQLVRTFWVAGWPMAPSPAFLADLCSMRGVNVDVCIRVTSESKREVLGDLRHTLASIDAEWRERADESDVTATDIDSGADAYRHLYDELRETGAQPWRVCAFVTVRADTTEIMEQATAAFEDHRLSTLKELHLDDVSEQVRRTLESPPAEAWGVPSRFRQREAFISASPNGPNVFEAGASVPKSKRVSGGAIGAMFPFATRPIIEERGLPFGRNEADGTPLLIDPFARGTSPHIITVGQSRSGKTFGASRAAARWYNAADDRTLVACDTQAGFVGLTELCDGKRIVVDGSQPINPLAISAPEGYEPAEAADQYRLKIDEGTSFISGILRAQGIDPSPYVSTIEEALEETYRAAGIHRHDPQTFDRDSPTLGDAIDTLANMLEDPKAYTHTGHETEAHQKVQQAADLLDKLSGFREGGKYHHLVSGDDQGLLDPDADMMYLDLQQLRDRSDAERSVSLQLMLAQMTQLVKQTPGETIMLLDEAHYLLHSKEMVQWLQRAAREWARYDACLWFVTQSPREFVQQALGTAGEENQRRTILDQCTTIQVFRSPRVESEILGALGMTERQADWVRAEATPGKAGLGYSECLLSVDDHVGWRRVTVEASPFEEYVLSYGPHDDGPFEEYVNRYNQP